MNLSRRQKLPSSTLAANVNKAPIVIGMNKMEARSS